jgi:nitrite reductase/ring-hydroxylating ferredoxin subunit|tara:strand:+ start:6 stop:374 length:369 start_codon:yes stop_codon:yes gene_type:complete
LREIFVAKEGEIADRDRKVVADNNLEIGVFRLGDEYYAWENNCPHSGGPVCQGRVMNRVTEALDDRKRSHGFRFVDEDVHIICPWHGFEFNIRTGTHPGDPQAQLNGFDITLRDGGIYVEVE